MVNGIEEVCNAVARKLLDHHEYADRTEVNMKSLYMVKRETPVSKTECDEVVEVHASAIADRNNGRPIVRRMIGAEVTGITACPCAQNIMKELASNKLRDLDVDEEKIAAFLDAIPMASHNQRGKGYLMIETDDDQRVELDDIINVLKDSMSARIFELLKRGDESHVVFSAHKNARFVEDCVREMAKQVVQKFSYLPGDSIITIQQTNEESIHQHDAYAERKATIAELKAEIGNWD